MSFESSSEKILASVESFLGWKLIFVKILVSSSHSHAQCYRICLHVNLRIDFVCPGSEFNDFESTNRSVNIANSSIKDGTCPEIREETLGLLLLLDFVEDKLVSTGHFYNGVVVFFGSWSKLPKGFGIVILSFHGDVRARHFGMGLIVR